MIPGVCSTYVIGCYFITVTLEIEMLYSVGIIEQEAILLAARPLQIGHRKTTKRYLKYEPPTQ